MIDRDFICELCDEESEDDLVNTDEGKLCVPCSEKRWCPQCGAWVNELRLIRGADQYDPPEYGCVFCAPTPEDRLKNWI